MMILIIAIAKRVIFNIMVFIIAVLKSALITRMVLILAIMKRVFLIISSFFYIKG